GSRPAVNRGDRGLFQTCRNSGGGGPAIVVGPHHRVGQARAAGTLFLWATSPAAASGGALSLQPRRRILLRYAQQREGPRWHPHQGNTEWSPRPGGRADMAATRLRRCQKGTE